jgi:hypothetical protein
VSQPILTILLVTLSLLLLAWVDWPRRTHRIRGTVAELEPRISNLMRSGRQTFLIVRIAGTKDFLQLTATPESAQIDFPLITDRQRELESRIREAASEFRLDFRETRGSDGSRFLDCDLTATPAEIARVSRQLLSRVFSMSEDARLAFESDAAI